MLSAISRSQARYTLGISATMLACCCALLMASLGSVSVQVSAAPTLRVLTAINISNFLNAHNRARANVNPRSATPLPNLVWDATLQANAENNVKTCNFAHRNGPYGENLAGGTPGLYPANDWEAFAVNQWLSEERGYNFEDTSCTLPTCGHYLQVVWAKTVKVGCARMDGCAQFPQSYISCQYDPPGNMLGQQPYQAASANEESSPSGSKTKAAASPSSSSSKAPASPSSSSSKAPASPSSSQSKAPASPSSSPSESNEVPSPSSSKTKVAASPSSSSSKAPASPSSSPSKVPAPSQSGSRTRAVLPSSSGTGTSTVAPSNSGTGTQTVAPSSSETGTMTASQTADPTNSGTGTQTAAPTVSGTSSKTPVPSKSNTRSAVVLPSSSASSSETAEGFAASATPSPVVVAAPASRSPTQKKQQEAKSKSRSRRAKISKSASRPAEAKSSPANTRVCKAKCRAQYRACRKGDDLLHFCKRQRNTCLGLCRKSF